VQGTVLCSKRHMFQWKTVLLRLLHKSAMLKMSVTSRSYRFSKKRIFLFSNFKLTRATSNSRCEVLQLQFACAEHQLDSAGPYHNL
jgi:hypothetical protein